MTDLNPYEAPVTVDLAESPGVRHEELTHVGLGLSIIYWGINAGILSMLIGPLLALVSIVIDLDFFGMAGGVVVGLGALGSAAAVLLGQVLCAFVPAKTRSKTMAVISAGLQLFGLGSSFLLLLFSIFVPVDPLNATPVAVRLVGYSPTFSMLVGSVSLIFFAVFLKQLNVYLGEYRLAENAATVVRLMLIFVGAYALLIVVMYGVAGPVPRILVFAQVFVLVVGLGLLAVGLVTFVKFTTVIRRTSRIIRGS